jgi:HD-GYP domain-containing protein (c-di-GMP phosphodiesterase class II)
LTSQRPYKQPWGNDKAFRELEEMAKDKLDKNCVDALVRNPNKVAKTQESFQG